MHLIAGTLVVLGSCVFFHELGHFIVAKLFGVRVHVFSLGFGTRLLGVEIGQTDYRISLIPFGGYVKMEGESDPGSSADPAAFSAKPRWQRVCVALAGPAMNFVLAVAALAAIYTVKYEIPSFLEKEPVVGYVLPGSSAAEAGIAEGDRILSVNSRETRTWNGVLAEVALASNKPLRVLADRGKTRLSFEMRLRGGDFQGLYSAGLLPGEPVVIKAVSPDSPASRAGLRAGDRITVAERRLLNSPYALMNEIRESAGRSLLLTILRDGDTQSITVLPEFNAEGNRWLIGVEFLQETLVKRLSVAEAIRISVADNIRYTRLTLRGIGAMISGAISVKNVAGPVGIARLSGDAAEAGILALLGVLGFISLNLAVINLFPILPLDGGVIFVLAVESILRRDLSARTRMGMQYIGLGFVLLLMALGLFNDLRHILKK